MTPASPRIICFDLGGVVVRICRTWKEACAQAGVPDRDPERFGRPDLARARKDAVELYQTGRITTREFWPLIAELTDGLYSPAEIERIHHAWIIEDYPGIADVIDRLNSAEGILTACLSNTNDAHWTAMLGRGDGHSSPAVRKLRHLGASHIIGAAKPGPDIYRRALRAMSARADEVLFFDDLAENIDAARSLGWRAEQIDPSGDTAEQVVRHCRSNGVAV